MTDTADVVGPITDRVHECSWSASLETPEHADDRGLVIRHAIEAIEYTAPGRHVNLVTHGDHGHPLRYLYPALDERFDPREVEWEYVERCGCGGHVTRVRIEP